MTRAHVSHAEWCTARGRLTLDRPLLVGILNVTPDSFHDGGRHADVEAAVAHAEQLLADGAGVLDIGGESTRPGARAVSADEESVRVVPVVEALQRRFPDAILSIDTTKAAVARRALDAGAAIINDVSAFRLDPAMAGVVAETNAGVIIMHSRGTTETMAGYEHAQYGNVVEDVRSDLCDATREARAAGIADDAIVVDPGLGFSKRTEHSVALLAGLDRIMDIGFPVMVGPSRKRFVADIAGGLPSADRLPGTIAACCIAYEAGVRLFRVHDVREVHHALALAEAVQRERRT